MSVEIIVNGKKLDGDEIVTFEKLLRGEIRKVMAELSNPYMKRGTTEFNILTFRRQRLASIIEKLETPILQSVRNK